MATKLEESIEAVIARILEHDRLHNMEMGVMLRKTDGEVLVEEYGNKNSVTFSEEQLALGRGQEALLIHNHPAPHPGSLSTDDIMVATTNDIETWAVTYDGGRYKTCGLLDAGLTARLGWGWEEKIKLSLAAVGTSRKTYVLVYNHLRNRAFQAAGLLDYRCVLGSEMRAGLLQVRALLKLPT